MSRSQLRQILFVAGTAVGLVLLLPLSGCGQKGGLFLPRDAAAAQRATLPAAIGATLPDFGGGYQNSDSPAPALPVPSEAVVTPTPAASTPLPADPRRRLP